MKKLLIDIQSGKITKEIDMDYDFYYGGSKFRFGVEFVYKEDKDKKNIFALINKNFEFVTEFCFDHFSSFKEGLAAVEINGKWGYINPDGEFVIEPSFKNAYDFENGLAKIQDKKTSKYGYINKSGELVVGYHDYLGDFSDGLVYAKNKKSKSYKFINEKGEVALTMKQPPKAATDSEIKSLNDFALQEFYKYVTMNYLEDLELELDYLGFKMLDDGFYDRHTLKLCKFHDGLCQFIKFTKDGPKVGFYDKTGNIVIPAEYDFASQFYKGISFYSNGNNIFDCKSGILTTTGERIEIGDFYWVSSLFYEDGELNANLFPMRANKRDGKPNANGKYGFVDTTGKIVISPQFDSARWLSYGMAGIDMGFLSGYANDLGEYIIPAQYDRTRGFDEHGYCVVSKYGQHGRLLEGIIDKTGNIIAPVVFDDIEILAPNRFFARSDNGYRLYDINGMPLTNDEYGSLIPINGNYALVDFDLFDNRINSDRGKYNPTGKIFRENCGEGMYVYFYECYPGCAKDHYHDFGIMKEDGTMLTDQMFEHIGIYSSGLIYAPYYYIDHDGKPILFNFYDNCTEFVGDIAYIVTHDWAHDKDGFVGLNSRKEPILEKPLTNNITKFFMNKQGDIIDLDLEAQNEFLQKYRDARKKFRETRKWPFEEYIPNISK